MSVVSSEEVVAQLRGIERDVEVLQHENVLTVDAWEKALANNEGASGAAFAKNLLLKDKNNKLYYVLALSSTEVDLKIISSRLGLGPRHIAVTQSPRQISPA